MAAAWEINVLYVLFYVLGEAHSERNMETEKKESIVHKFCKDNEEREVGSR